MVGKQWLWWQLFLAIKPMLKAGNFEQFKQDLAKKTVYAADHLDDVIRSLTILQNKGLRCVG